MPNAQEDLSNDDLIKSIIQQEAAPENTEQPEAPTPEPTDSPVEKKLEEMTQDEMEEKAKIYGWHSEYDGPNKKSAKQFLEDGLKKPGLAIRDKQRLERENEVLRKYNENLLNTSAETIKKLKAEADRRITELENDKKLAKENLDMDAYDKATTEQQEVKTEKQKLENTAPPIDPTVQIWAQENNEFIQKVESDKVLTNYADAVALEMRNELLQLPPAQRFQKVMERVKADLPHKFENSNQQQAPKVNSMQRTQTPNLPNQNKISISTLPKDVKEGYDLIVKSITFKTPDEKKAYDDRFLENYKLMKGDK